MTQHNESTHELDEAGVARRDALKQGLATVAAGGIAFSSPKIQGLAVKPKHGSALSQIKKRRRCRTGPVRFRCRPRQWGGWGNFFGPLFNGDPEGVCRYKGGSKSHKDDFKREDIETETGTGTIEGDSIQFSFLVAENTGNESPIIFQFLDSRLSFSRINFVGANNSRIPGDVYDQFIGDSGSATAPVMWQTPSWASGTNTVSMSASFEEASDSGQDQSYK